MGSSQYFRVIGHVGVALACASFIVGLVLHCSDVSSIKTIVFFMLLLVWFVIQPLLDAFWEGMSRVNRNLEMRYTLQKFLGTYVFPPVIVCAFIWMAFTTWKRDPNEHTLGRVFRQIISGTKE